jgi:hypothetical protein
MTRHQVQVVHSDYPDKGKETLLVHMQEKHKFEE